MRNCNGTGVLAAIQPVRPDRRIYPPPCEACGGRDGYQRRTSEALNASALSNYWPLIRGLWDQAPLANFMGDSIPVPDLN
jgi:hypothetical protein